MPRPPFIIRCADVPENAHRYPHSDEAMGPSRPVGRAAGLAPIGLHVQRLPPGTRSSYPHAEEDEEELVYVLEGEVLAWIDGDVHPMRAGDPAAFPAGTGITHTFMNEGPRKAVLLVDGEQAKSHDRLIYPPNPFLPSRQRRGARCGRSARAGRAHLAGRQAGTGIPQRFWVAVRLGNPERRGDMPWSNWWDDAPERPLGPHPGRPGSGS